jgi:hypothetical protein
VRAQFVHASDSIVHDFAVRKHRQTFVRQERTSFAAVALRGAGAVKEPGNVLNQTTKLSTFLFTLKEKLCSALHGVNAVNTTSYMGVNDRSLDI